MSKDAHRCVIRVSVLLNEAEYAEVKRKAGLVPLSAWFRNLANLGGEVRVENSADKPAERTNTGGANPVRGSSRKVDSGAERKSGRTCKHGTPKGDNCWQCGGLAQVGGE